MMIISGLSNALVMASDVESGSWNIGDFLSNATSNIKSIMGLIVVLVGVVMIGIGVFKIAHALISHGKAQTSWVVNIALILVGGALMAGGFGFVSKIAEGGQKTITDLGNGEDSYDGTKTIMPYDAVLDGFEFDMGD